MKKEEMRNIEKEKKDEDETGNLTLTIICLGCCSFLTNYTGISLRPYIGFMVMHLVEGTTRDTVGIYSGYIEASSLLGAMSMGYAWGRIADTYGRKFVIVSCLILQGASSLLFGTAQSLGMAIFSQFIGGISHGLFIAIKSVAHEISPQHEKEIMGIIFSVKAFVSFVSPALGGLLSEPLNQFPSLGIDNNYGWIRDLLERYPFLLPNLFSFILCFIMAIATLFIMPETLPSDNRQYIIDLPRHLYNKISTPFCLCLNGATDQERLPILTHKSSTDAGLAAATLQQQDPPPSSSFALSFWNSQASRSHAIIQWIFSFILAVCAGSFPLFAMSQQGGLGISEASIGTIMSSGGALFVLLQYVVYIRMNDWFGMYNAIFIASLLAVQTRILITASLLLPRDTIWIVLIFLTIVQGISKIFSSVFLTTNTRAMNKSVPSHQRATMNGVVMAGGSALRSFAPILSGFLSTYSYGPTGPGNGTQGSLLVYGVISFAGLCISRVVWNVTRQSIERERINAME